MPRISVWAALLTAAALSFPAGAAAGQVFTVEQGREPSILTDPVTGDAKLVWTAKDEYSVRFCSIPRGTTTCTPQTLFAQPPDIGKQVGRAQLVRDTDGTLYIVLHRYVNNSQWVLRSGDGGATWDAGTRLLDRGPGIDFNRPVLGPAPGQITLASGGNSISAPRLDGSTAATGVVAELPKNGNSSLVYFLTLANDGDGLVATATDLHNAFYWHLNPGADPTNAANWSGPTLIGPSGDSALGGARSGPPFLLDVGGPNVQVRRWNGAGFGAPTILEPAGGYIPAIGASPGGKLAVVYRLNGSPNSERAAVSVDGGATWQTRTIAMSDGIYRHTTVSPDEAGGGWAAWIGTDPAGTNDMVTVTDLSATTTVTCTPTYCPPAPPPVQPPASGGHYSGPTGTTTVGDRNASYSLTGVPRQCVNPGATFRVTLKWKRKKRKGNVFVKIYRTDFYIGKKRVKIDRKAPFVQTLRVTMSAKRGSTQTVRARAFIKVKRGKSPKKSIRAKFKVCP